jgi:Tol biopolymer transport system component
MIARRAAAWLLCGALLLPSTAVAGPYDPALRFVTHRTPHFTIHFHAGEERLAARLAEIGESVRDRISRTVGRPGPPAHVVLVDQADLSNGLATVVPWNAIVIYAAPPSGADTIGNTDDWLEYVFTHEYAHVVQLDRSRGWARLARGLFGRSPIAFPNLTLPLWHIEGLATLVESESGHGRLHAGDFRSVVDVAARAGTFEPLDRVNGGLVDWPAGHGWYAYGARFHEYLLRKYGAERLVALSERTAGRLPFLTAGAFRAVYGRSLGDLWRDFRNHVERDAAIDRSEGGRRLTRLGYLVDAPREDRQGRLYASATDAHDFPAIVEVTGDGASRMAERYGGTGLTFVGTTAIFDQLEFARGVALFSDLYAHDRIAGTTRRLTRQSRLAEPDLAPDGRRLAVVSQVTGGRALLVLDAETLLAASDPIEADALPVLGRAASEPTTIFAAPRWSPDGRVLAVERRALGGPSTIAILDGATLEDIATLAAPEGGRLTQPAWTPDGATLLFAAADADRPFEIRAVDPGPGGRLTTPRRVLAPEGGARAPLPRRDGSLVYVGYTDEGADLFALDPGIWRRDGGAMVAAGPSPSGPVAAPPTPTEGAPYSPWRTLVPRAWQPRIESRDNRVRLGGGIYTTDVLGRHVVSAGATWAVSSPHAHRALAPPGRPDWDAAYTYQRWQPAFYVTAGDRTSLFDVVDATGLVRPLAQRERTLDVGVWHPIRRVRWAQTLLAAYHVEQYSTSTASAAASLRRAGLRGAWTFSSARRFGHSISQEDGVAVGATAEVLRPGLGSDGAAEAWTGDVRAYVPLWPRHAVLAVRVAGAASSGEREVRRRFRLGGTDSNALTGAFGNDAVSLLRGFQNDVFVGERVALANLEARIPIVSVQRGWGTWPIFLRAVHGASFVDIGHAWSSSPRWGDRKIGYGAEVSADAVVGFGLPLTLTGGVAWGRDGAGLVADTRELYFRVGRSF